MENKGYAFCLCLVAVASIALMSSALATIEWTVATIARQNETGCSVTRKLGLFNGKDVKAGCISDSSDDFSIYDTSYLEFNHGVQIAVTVFIAISVLCALTAMAVSAFNVCSNPYETCLAPVAILGYNVAGCAFALIAVIMYTVLMYTELIEPLIDSPDGDSSGIYRDQGYSVTEAYFGYSFFLLVVSLATFLLGVMLSIFSEKNVITTLKDFCCPKKETPDEDKGKEIMMF